MQPRIRWNTFALLTLVFGMLLAACGGAVPSATTTTAPSAVAAAPTTAANGGTAQATTTVRMGYIAVLIYAPIFVGIERGYFREQGLDLQLTPLQGGSDSVVQLAAGNFDVAVGGAGAGFFNAANRGVKFTIVAPMHNERPPLTTSLVISAKRTGEIKTVADLKGKKVAINATGAATEWWLVKALESGGLTVNDIQLQTLAFRDVPAALDSGALDAAMLGDPLTTINVDNKLVSILSNDFLNDFVSTYLYMGEPFLAQQPAAARGFLKAYLQACRDLQGSYMNDDIAKIIEKYTQVPADVVKRSSPPQYDAQGRIPLDNLNTLQNHFLQRGVLEYKELLDMSKFVNSQLAAEVAAELDAER